VPVFDQSQPVVNVAVPLPQPMPTQQPLPSPPPQSLPPQQPVQSAVGLRGTDPGNRTRRRRSQFAILPWRP
jgi:hypothetical protein